ncbi:MAG TPA: DMT family transporter [Kofleriaceae bacterium]|nr:DMT family transporter [Kofleriaceae bacterium]
MQSGELAALGTATCWTVSSLAFEAGARRIGSLSLNLARVILAFAWLTVLALVTRGLPFPSDATAAQWGWLGASGLVGIVLGDLCTFRAYVDIGARRTMVLSTAVPIFTAALAWIALGEQPSFAELAGMTVIVAGVMLAVSERGKTAGVIVPRASVRGVVLGIGGSLGQAGGLLLSKQGMAGYDAVPATQIRMIVGIAGFAVVLGAAGWLGRFATAVRDRRAMGATAFGALLGPCIGIALSLYAVTHAKAGVAASLMSLSPILVIPLVLARGERVGWAGFLGAVLAVAGVAILALL